jgi:hypothetical protein
MGEAKRTKGFEETTDFKIIPPVSCDIKYDGTNSVLKEYCEAVKEKYPYCQLIPFKIVYRNKSYDTILDCSPKPKDDEIQLESGIITELPSHTLGKTKKTQYRNAVEIKQKILDMTVKLWWQKGILDMTSTDIIDHDTLVDDIINFSEDILMF